MPPTSMELPRPINTYERYVRSLRQVCRLRDLGWQRIGSAGRRGEYGLFKVTAGLRVRPPRTICISAGLHGDEISGPLAALELTRKFDWRSLRRLRVVILPLCNPWGFDNGRRTNARHMDLNRRFVGQRPPGEAGTLYDAIRRERLDLFASFHEDDERRRFYLYANNNGGQETGLHREIKGIAGRYLPVSRRRRIDNHEAKDGVIFNVEDNSFEHRMHVHGVPETVCVEVSDRLPLDRRVELARLIMEAMIRNHDRP